MKIILNEEKRLPLTFKYMEVYRDNSIKRESAKSTRYIKSDKIKSDFLNQSEPFKPLVRIL